LRIKYPPLTGFAEAPMTATPFGLKKNSMY
jgi:hypothetical protein